MTKLDQEEINSLVALAIKVAWTECGEVPFPLYDREALQLAIAAIDALDRARKATK